MFARNLFSCRPNDTIIIFPFVLLVLAIVTSFEGLGEMACSCSSSRVVVRRFALSSRVTFQSQRLLTSLSPTTTTFCNRGHKQRNVPSSPIVRCIFGSFSKFDPLNQSSATILKQSNEELSKEELNLKQVLEKYQQQHNYEENNEYQTS